MTTLRRITLSVLLAAALAVLMLAVYLLWNRHSLPPGGSYAELLSWRVGDMELLVIVLLSASGLYSLVFVLSSYVSAVTFGRQADRSIASIKDQLGVAMKDLRKLKADTENTLREQSQNAAEKLDRAHEKALAMIQEEIKRSAPVWNGFEPHLATIGARIESLSGEEIGDQERLEVMHYENAAGCLELLGSGPALAGFYHALGNFHAPDDMTRARFYLNRALALAPSDSEWAPEVHYDLACLFARGGDFKQALEELAAAFKRHSKVLDQRLTRDIEEGGDLYELAATPPFDKALNDVLLNVSIGMG